MSSDHAETPRKGRDLTTGPIGKQLWSLAWPMMLSMFFHTLYNIVDAFWVSKLSPESIAAVSISQITFFLMMSLGFGITAGSGVVMSMDIGAKNQKGAERVLGQSFVLTAIMGLFFTVFSLVFRTQLLTATGAAGAIFDPALQYFTINAAGSLLFFTMIAIMFAFNAQGDTFTLTKLFAVSTLLNGILDPILIFGWYGAPELGIRGAGFATLASQAVFIVIALYSLSRPRRTVPFHFRNLSFQWESVKKVLKIGIPAALTQVINPIGLAALTYMTSQIFLEPGAIAFSLGFRIEFFAYLPAVGYGFAAMAMMGQNIGAEKLARAKEVLRTALKYGCGIALAFGITIALFAPYIVAVFTDDPVAGRYAELYFRIVALSYVFLAAIMIQSSAFQAIGKSWPGFWIMFVRFLVVSLPLGYVLTMVLHLPISAMWASIVAGNITAAVMGYVWLRKKLNAFDFKEVEETVHVGA